MSGQPWKALKNYGLRGDLNNISLFSKHGSKVLGFLKLKILVSGSTWSLVSK